MFSKFFIDRPIFASVLSIVITLAGAIAVWVLPLSLYPPISPPTVSVDCNYPGASAQVVSETVATPIEQQVNGVENMMYMSSQCTNDGTYNLTVTFKHGMNLNMAQVLVQNRVALAAPMLPDVIKQTGVNVKKMSPDILLALAINSPSGAYDQLYLSNYAMLQVRDELLRLPGISDVRMLGQRDYSMRIWVDPDKLASRDMTASDVANAVRMQNSQVATGSIGQPPSPRGQVLQVPIATVGRLSEVEQFESIIVKSSGDGRVVRLKDVARVELGAKNEDISGQVNRRPSVSLAIFQLPDANALDTADIVRAKIKELESNAPAGVNYEIRYDTTPFIRESIGEVVKTLEEAVVLVAVVVLLFLQNWRSAIIPLVAVPVAIIGTFAVMAAIGFTLNNLTLFGLVLAIGIVVDDAIVVVEAVEHHIERGMNPRDATVRAMEEVSGPVIAIGLVLTAVFIPCAFITGIVGQFFRQFALTIATSTIISAFNSLTLSPALAALLIKPRDPRKSRTVLPLPAFAVLGGWLGWDLLTSWLVGRYPSFPGGPWALTGVAVVTGMAAGVIAGWPLNYVLAWLFGAFNATFRLTTSIYTRMVGGLLRVSALVIVVYVGMLGLTYWGFQTTPTGFIPSQDMGYLLSNVQLPDSASQERTRSLMDKLETIAHEIPGVKHTQAMTGQSLLLSANGSNFGSMFVILDAFHERPDPVFERFFVWYKETLKVLDDRADAIDYSLVMLRSADISDSGYASNPGPYDPTTDRIYYKKVKTASESSGIAARWLKASGGPWLKRRFDGILGKPGREIRGVAGSLPPPKPGRIETWLAPESSEKWVRQLGLSKADIATLDGLAKTAPVGEEREKAIRAWKETKREHWSGRLALATREWLGLAWPKPPSLYSDGVANTMRQRFAKEVPEAMITVLGPPPVRGVGRAGGFKIMVEDRGDNGSQTLQGQTEFLTDLSKGEVDGKEVPATKGKLVGMTSVFRANVPQVFVDVNRQECMSKDVALKDLFDTMRIYLGSLYVNDFNLFGRTWQVVVQAEPRFRNKIDDVRRLKVRNASGGMVPVSALAEVKLENGPLVLTRYNMYPAAPINGSAAPGVSSGEAIRLVEEQAENLIGSMAYEWTELAYLEIQAGNTAMLVFGAAVVMVFLVLAAQYESWSMPLAVILVVPMCLLSGVAGVKVSYQDINIFTQIGFVVLVGLASKNAILIVEFAKHRREEGETPREAALDACRLRFRPIVMTSFAFILGVVPLIVSQGAGAEMRRTLGITVFSGMLGVTLFGVFLTPVFFVVIDRLGSTAFFQSKAVRWAGEALSAAVVVALAWTLLPGIVYPLVVGIVWILLRQLSRIRRQIVPARELVPASATNGKPHGDDHTTVAADLE